MGDHPHIVQVLITTATEAPLGHKRFHPIYEAAERHGLPVAVHPGAEGRAISGQPTAAGWVSKYIEWHTCLPQTRPGPLREPGLPGRLRQVPHASRSSSSSAGSAGSPT